MKKLHTLGLEKILLLSGFTLALTVVGFWQFQNHANDAEKLARVQSGVGTCFARVTQTFTAAMIKEYTSPYLKRDFMALSDDCLREGTKAAGIDLKNFTKADKIFNELVSEVYWFHEKVIKVMSAIAQPKAEIPMQAITEKFSKVEGLKLDLNDQIDVIGTQLREARLRSKLIVGASFFMFMLCLALLGWRELINMRHKRSVERHALSMLNTGHAQTGGMIDQMIQNALTGQGMVVTAQVFADYHASVLERMASRISTDSSIESEEAKVSIQTISPQETQVVSEPEIDARKLLTAQAIRLKASMEVQEANIVADAEVVTQLLHAFGQRFSSGQVSLTGKRDGERYIVCVEANEVCLTAAELEYSSGARSSMDGVDVNIVIGMDIIRESNIDAIIRNKMNATGTLLGAEAIFSFPISSSRSLVNIVRGKKKDLLRVLSPSQYN